MNGIVARIGIKPQVANERGLPKPSVAEARVTTGGLVGDYNLYRQEEMAGDPDSAVLLLARETIDELNREGWAVNPGDLGENFTTERLSLEALRPGQSLALGSVEVVVSRRCDPCTNLFALPYVGKARGPAFLKAALDRRGWYAKVTREGTVRVGDPIRWTASPSAGGSATETRR